MSKHHGDIIYIKSSGNYYLVTWNDAEGEYSIHGALKYKGRLNTFEPDVVDRLYRKGKWFKITNLCEVFFEAVIGE